MALSSGILKQLKSSQAKAIGIYTFSNFLNKGVSFLFLFYFAHALTESDFGLLNLFSCGILFLMPFISMGIIQSVNTDFFKLEKKEFKDFFTTTLLMPFVVMILAIIVLYSFKSQLHQRYAVPVTIIILVPINTFLNFLGEQLIYLVRNNDQPKKYLFVNIGSLLIELGLAVFCISVLKYGWIGRVTGITVSGILVAVYAFVYFKQQGFIFGKIVKKYIYKELIYSVPIIVMQISIFCNNSASGYFIKYFTKDYASVGIYSVAATFASIVMVLSSALLHYFYPRIYRLLSEKEINYKAIRKNFLYYAGAMLLCTILVIAITPFAYVLALKKSYFPGLKYYYFICIGYFLWSITFFFYSFMLYHKMKRKILYLSLISIVISLSSNYFYIKNYGSFGAALSICTIYFLILIVTLLFGRKQIVPILQGK
jgi:O-antigen/teichoic acid export membrane protein